MGTAGSEEGRVRPEAAGKVGCKRRIMGRMKQEEDDVESERRPKRATPDRREIGKGKEMATLEDAQGRGGLETCAANGVGKRGQAVTVGEHTGSSSSVGGRVLSGELRVWPCGWVSW